MTEAKLDFLEKFFHSDRFPGALSIGRKLMVQENVIVAGDGLLWGEELMSYVTISDPTDKGYISCSELSFNKVEFFKSNIYIEKLDERLNEINSEIEIKRNEISSLVSELNTIKYES